MKQRVTSLAAAMLFAIAASPFAGAQTLRPTVLVSSDLVRIGDLVANVAADKADIAVFRAPDLGETGSVNVQAVIEALRPHEVGIEAQGLSEVSVTRASRMVGANEIKDRIAEILAERLRAAGAENVTVTLDQPALTLHLDPSDGDAIVPSRITFEPRGGRFDALFRAGPAQVRVTGNAVETQEAVVLTRAVPRGDVLRESDVILERRPKSEIQADTVRDLEAAIGMAAQQPLRPGQVIRNADLARPQLVKRNEPVMIVYEVPGIVLTARGRAEENGSLGDTVNVLNIQSKRVIQGVVSGPGQITVTSLTPRILSRSPNIAAADQPAATRSAQTKTE